MIDRLVNQGRACFRCGLAPANAHRRDPRSRLLELVPSGPFGALLARCRNRDACRRRRRVVTPA